MQIIGARESRRQLFERGRPDTIDDPVPVVHWRQMQATRLETTAKTSCSASERSERATRTERAVEAARERACRSSAFAKATADIAEASAEACRGAKPLGGFNRY